MRDQQLARLTRVLQQPKCAVWAMNIGESPRLSEDAWWAFAEGLKTTKLGAMFAEPNHLPSGVKPQMIDTLRENRKIHRSPILFFLEFTHVVAGFTTSPPTPRTWMWL